MMAPRTRPLRYSAEFGDPRLRVQARTRAGCSASRNYGLSLARGELIAFLDADDLWLPDKLQLQVAALDEHPEAALAYVWTDYIDHSNRFMHPGQHTSSAGWVFEQLLTCNFIETGSNPVVRCAAIAECGGFDESLTAAEDWDLWLRLARRYQIVAVSRTLVLYRVLPGSMSSDVLRQERTCLEVMNRMFREAGVPSRVRRRSLATLYNYLTYRALIPPFDRKASRVALRFWCAAVRNQPSLLMRSSSAMVTVAKILVALLLPGSAQHVLIDLVRSLRPPIASQADHGAEERLP